MTPVITDFGIVLRKIDFSDTSLIIHLFTRSHGIVPLLAKGAQRDKSPLRGVLDIPAYLAVRFSNRKQQEMQLLLDADLQEPFFAIRKNLSSFFATLYAMELIEEAGKPAGSDHLFDWLLLFLRSMQERKGETMTLLTGFELGLLKQIGLQPALHDCASCGRPLGTKEPAKFFPSAGGVLCGNCQIHGKSAVPIPSSALQIMGKLSQASWSQITRTKLATPTLGQIRRALDAFLQYHWERMPKSRSQLDTLLISTNQ